MNITDLDNNYTIEYSYVEGIKNNKLQEIELYNLHAIYTYEMLSINVDPRYVWEDSAKSHMKTYMASYIEFGGGNSTPDRIIEWFYDEELVK